MDIEREREEEGEREREMERERERVMGGYEGCTFFSNCNDAEWYIPAGILVADSNVAGSFFFLFSDFR
jgi:hypothetical protein